jgi:hypothetical protein
MLDAELSEQNLLATKLVCVFFVVDCLILLFIEGALL